MGPVRGEIQWNEASRVLLIETVIQVEQEIRNNPNLQVSGKWDRINSLLPPHLRGRTWSYQQVYDQYKCSRMFATLVEVYRSMKFRKPSDSSGRVILTRPVFDALKKREDLLNSQRSPPMENGLKSVSTTRVSNSTGSAIDQKLQLPSINVGDAEIQWDETARVLLVESVIQVEEEIRSNPDVKVRGKWHRINSLLPPHLRGRTWSSQQQTYNAYKSARLFGALLEVYRGIKRGMPKLSHGKLTLTKPVFDAMKKHEDLMNTQRSIPAKNGLKSGIPTRVRNSTGSAGDQELPSSSINAGGYRNANKKWDETALILLVKAVMKVEEDFRNNPKFTGKWTRINNLLPPHLRGRSAGCKLDYKCRRTFQRLLEGYKGKRRGRSSRSLGLTLTKPVLELLTKREDTSNSRRSTPSENSLNSGNPTRVSNNCSLLSDQNLLSPSMNSFTSTHTNRGHWPGRQTSGNATERKEKGENFAQTASDSKQRLPWTRQLQESFVDAVTEVGGAGKALAEDVRRVMGVEGLTLGQVRSHLQMYRLRYIAKSTSEETNLEKESSEDLIATKHSPSTNHAGYSLGYASVSGGESEGPENQNDSFMLDSKAYTRYDDHRHSILDELLRRLGLEFSSLSSWVESKLIPDGKKAMYGMTSSTNQSVKRRKLNAGTDPLYDILQQSRTKWIDLQIRASFQRLKVQFGEELKDISMEVLQVVRRDIYLHDRTSDSSHGERRDKFSSKYRSISTEIR